MLDADANYNIHVDGQAENGDTFKGDSDTVCGLGDRHGADGQGAHHDAGCKICLLKNTYRIPLFRHSHEPAVIQAWLPEKAKDDFSTIIFDPTFPINNMAPVVSCTTDCRKLGKYRSQKK